MRLRLSVSPVAALAAALMCVAGAAHAVDSISVEAGAGSKVEMVRVGLQWDWDSRWLQSNGSHIGGYWDVSLAQWRGTRYENVPGQHQNITSIGLTPVLRWQQDNKKGWYGEVGVGANLLSRLYNNNGNRLSTRFEFGDHVAVGYVFNNNWDLALKIHHYSNADIKKPNDGVDFAGLRAKYKF